MSDSLPEAIRFHAIMTFAATRPNWTTDDLKGYIAAAVEMAGDSDHRCPVTSGFDRCQLWRGHPHSHQIIDGRNAQGSQ